MPKKKWIQEAIKKPGALHKALGVPAGKDIPAKMMQPKKGDTSLMKRRKALARTLAKMHK